MHNRVGLNPGLNWFPTCLLRWEVDYSKSIVSTRASSFYRYPGLGGILLIAWTSGPFATYPRCMKFKWVSGVKREQRKRVGWLLTNGRVVEGSGVQQYTPILMIETSIILLSTYRWGRFSRVQSLTWFDGKTVTFGAALRLIFLPFSFTAVAFLVPCDTTIPLF